MNEQMDELRAAGRALWQPIRVVLETGILKLGLFLLPAFAFGCRFTNHWLGSGWNPLVSPRGMRCDYCGAER